MKRKGFESKHISVKGMVVLGCRFCFWGGEPEEETWTIVVMTSRRLEHELFLAFAGDFRMLTDSAPAYFLKQN